MHSESVQTREVGVAVIALHSQLHKLELLRLRAHSHEHRHEVTTPRR